jgi:hypothetical protein
MFSAASWVDSLIHPRTSLRMPTTTPPTPRLAWSVPIVSTSTSTSAFAVCSRPALASRHFLFTFFFGLFFGQAGHVSASSSLAQE